MTTPSFGYNFPDFSREVFGQNPELAFLGRLGQAGGGRQMQDYFRRRTGDFLSRFQQQLSRQLLEADPNTFNPSQLSTPEDFFGGINFRNEFLSQAPTQRGFFSGQFAPHTRWLTR